MEPVSGPNESYLPAIEASEIILRQTSDLKNLLSLSFCFGQKSYRSCLTSLFELDTQRVGCFVPDLVAKTQNPSMLYPRFEEFTILSLLDFVNGDRDKMPVEHVLVHCSKFQNQRRKYHLEGKSIGAILDDHVDVGSLVGYLQDEVFNII